MPSRSVQMKSTVTMLAFAACHAGGATWGRDQCVAGRASAIFPNARSPENPMTDPSPKQLAIHALEQLPENATLEDAMERLYLLESIERGRADVRAGRTVSHEDVKRRFGIP